MKFLKLSKLFGAGWGRKIARRAAKSASPNRLRLRLEELEDRIAPSVTDILPALTVSNSSTIGTGFNPQIVIDPVNSQKMVEVHTTGSGLAGNFSTNGGASWNAFAFSANVANPNLAAGAFTAVSSPSVSFDSLENFYVVDTQHDASSTSGAVVIEKFSFASGSANPVTGTQSVLYRWYNQDAAANPVVGVDTNRTTYTDPQTFATQTDSLAATRTDATYGVVPKAVYVAWNVNSTQPGGGLTSKVMVEASEDGGHTFSTMQRAGVAGSPTNSGIGSAPQILFTQQTADHANAGGKLTFVWSNGTAIIVDQTSPDGGVAATPVVATQTFTFAGGTIADAASTSTNLTWTLNGQIDASQTTLTVVAGGPTPPTGNFNVKIDQETLTVTGTSGNLWTVIRGVSSTAAAHIIGSTITYTAAGTSDVAQTTTFTGAVNITQADLTTIKDLDVTINMVHPNLDQVKITLTAPASAGGFTITLVNNRVDNAGTTLAQGVAAGANMGELVRGGIWNDAGTVFDQSADRSITDGSASAEYVGHFRPESGSLSQFNGRSAASMYGTWTIAITDFRNSSTPVQSLKNWSLNFTGLIDTNGFGADKVVTGATTVPGSATNTYTSTGTAYGTPGVGPGVVVAQDKTLGSYSQYQGRIYLAYTQGTYNLAGALVDTNVYLKYSDDNGASWSSAKRVNDDTPSDNFSEGNRPQFTPSIAVDQSTGTLVFSYYDARNDAALARVANTVVASIDGGANFSPVTYFNSTKTATDFLTSNTSSLGPIPGNQSQAGANGFGDREGIVAISGKIFAVFASNLNAAGSSIFLGKAVTAAGPRVLFGDMGPVVADFTNGALTYNNTLATDGTRQLSGFVVEFDRPVDAATFTASKVAVRYQNPNSGVVSNVAVGSVSALDSGGFGPRFVGAGVLSKRFYVSLQTPQTAVGTYSYSVGPDISDKIRTTVAAYTLVAPTGAFVNPFASADTPIAIPDLTTVTSNSAVVPSLPAGQVIGKVTVTLNITHTYDSDLAITLISPTGTRVLLSNHNGPAGNNFAGTTFDDAASTAIAAGSAPYSGTFKPDSPLAALIGQDPSGTWKLEVADTVAIDSGTLNSWSVKFTPAAISYTSVPGNQMDQNANSVTNEASVDAFAIPTPKNGIPFVAPYDNGTLPLIIPGPHVVGSGVPNNPVSSDNLVLNSTNNAINVTFDRDIISNTFTSAAIVSMIGPSGAISGPFTVTATTPGTTSRTFRIGFPTQTLSGSYYIVFGPTITDTLGNAMDTSQNAGVDLLRGYTSSTASHVTTTYQADYGQTGLTIAPKSTFSTTISVADGYTIDQSTTQGKYIQLQLNLLHQNIPDLTATLTAPDGTVVELFSGAGTLGSTPHANFSNTVLTDSASNSIQQTGTPISIGPFNPKTQLSVLNGKGSYGTWTLTIYNNSATYAGTLTHWEVRLPKAVPGSGLGEATADQATVSFRIFTQASTNAQSSTQWTPIGPAAANSGGNSGRIGGLAVDPSDPTGNTVYVAGASGGVWKTNNFLTTSANGPTYVQLTDLGPSYSLNIGSLAVFGRNNDPNKTIVFAATGEGDTSTPGTGFLRSMDGGKTWQVLDSTTNVDGNGKILPMNSASRDHVFVGSTSFKVVVDPTALTDGNVAVYAALSGTNGGLWRSLDSGNTWFRVRAGSATDVVLASASGDSNGNLGVLYAAFRGDGVYITHNALTASSLTLMSGGQISTPRVDDDLANKPQIPTTAPSGTPNGSKGRIVLATPALTNNPLQDRFYQGWLYAAVVTATGGFDGLYLTKDFGLNWTKLNLPSYTPTATSAYGTNNETRTNYDVVSHGKFSQGNYDISFAIDPNNPNITYLGGTADGASFPAGGFIRIDATTVSDPYSLVAYGNNKADGGTTQFASTGPTSVKLAGAKYGILDPNNDPYYGTSLQIARNSYLNLYREPTDPFVSPSTLHYTNVSTFNNDGQNVRWMGFNDALGSSTDQHKLIAFRDSVTGKTRLIFGDDQGVWTGVDNGDGTLLTSVGTQSLASYSRNGNLQITQFYYGASQPSTLASELAGSMFYGMAQDNGSLNSAKNVLTTGNLNWTGVPGDGTGVATDQSGAGTKYEYRWPCCINQAPFSATDFFLVKFAGQAERSRVSGLVQTGDDPFNNAGQWPFTGGSNFAVNNYDSSAIVMSSQAGRIFLTAGGTTTTGLGYGVQWHVIGEPSDLDGSYAAAVAFGAPSAAGVGTKNDFIYAGTQGGKIFVTFTGGGYNGSSKWRDISSGLDGSAVQSIVTNPKFGSHEAYAVTRSGVYWMQDSSALSPKWIKINDLTTGASTTINQTGGITATDTTMTVAAGGSAGFPTVPFYVKIGAEVIQVANVNAVTDTWTIVRGVNGSTAAAHSDTSPVNQYSNGLFGLSRPVFNNSSDQYPSIRYLTSLAIDWRYSIPNQTGDNPTTAINQTGGIAAADTSITVASAVAFPAGSFVVQIDSEQILVSNITGTTWTNVIRGYNNTIAAAHADTAKITQINLSHPVLYVGGEGGVYRTRDKGQTWTDFPNISSDAATQDGGWLPNAHVSDLDLQLGNFNTTTGFYDTSAGNNLLQATTYGRGTFVIRLDNSAISQYLVAPNSGPRITAQSSVVANNGTTLAGFTVTFGGAVDPSTFTPADVTVTGPTNQPISIASVADISGNTTHNVYRIDFTTAQSANGSYTLKIGPYVYDFAGNPMNQNGNTVNGEIPGDIYTNTITFSANTPPTISTIATKQVAPNTTLSNIPFTIGDAETPVASLTVSATSSNQTIIPDSNIALSGTNANRFISITAPNVHGSTVITITVTDGGGLTAQSSFTLNVDNAPTMSTIGNTSVVHGSTPTSISLGINDVDGDSVTATVALLDPLFAVKTTYGLDTADYTQYFNGTGVNEKYFRSSNGSNSANSGFYILLPNNKLYAWLSTIQATLAASPVVDFAAAYGADVYANPALLYTNTGTPLATVSAGDALATAGTALYDLKVKYGLDTPGAYFNQGGGNEWWLHSSNGGNPTGEGWFLLLPNNTLVAWSGSRTTALLGFNNLIADLSSYGNVYGTPSLLTGAAPTTVTAVTASVSPNPVTTFPGGTLTITPIAAFERSVFVTVSITDGLSPAVTQTFTYTVTNSKPTMSAISDNTIAHNTSSVTFNISGNVTDAGDASTKIYTVNVTGVASSDALANLAGQYGLHTADRYYNQGGMNDRWFYSDNGSNNAVFASSHQGYYVLISNKLYAWNGVSVPSTIAGGASSPYFVADFMTAAYGNQDVSATPSLLYNAQKKYDPAVYVNRGPLYDVKMQYGLDTPDQYYNQGLVGDKWLHSNNNSNPAGGGWYILMPTNKLYAWNGVSVPSALAQPPVVDLSAYNVYNNPSLLYGAQAVFVSDAIFSVRSQFGLYTADQYFNQGLVGDKWLHSGNGSNAANGGWYILMSGGNLYAWNGISVPSALAQSPVANVGAAAYTNPYLLYSDSGESRGATATISGSGQITLTRNAAFADKVRVTVTESDGAEKASQSFLFTVTDAAPTAPTLNANPTAIGGTGTTVNFTTAASDTDSGAAPSGNAENLQFKAVIGDNPLFQLKTLYGLNTADQYFNTYGANEKFFHSSNGSNPTGGGFYVLTTANKLYAWDGVSYSTTINQTPVAAFNVGNTIYEGADVYNNTALLFGAAATANLSQIGTASLTAGSMSLTWPSGFTGKFLVTYYVGDGAKETQMSFLVTVN